MFPTDDWDPDRMMNGSYGGGMMGGGVWMMAMFGLLLLVLTGIVIFWAIKTVGSPPNDVRPAAGPASGSPRDVLDLRLARGEISAEEYGTTRTLLGL
jgi:uncharacterized membrane protein